MYPDLVSQLVADRIRRLHQEAADQRLPRRPRNPAVTATDGPRWRRGRGHGAGR